MLGLGLNQAFILWLAGRHNGRESTPGNRIFTPVATGTYRSQKEMAQQLRDRIFQLLDDDIVRES